MNFVNAEITKISVNTYVTMKISYANQLAEICEGLEGADVNVVSSAVGADTRVGKKYIKGAMGYGGPCFPRDNKAFSWVAKRIGTSAPLADATDSVNYRQVSRAVQKVTKNAPNCKNVTVIGMSYKQDTPVIEESQGIMIVQQLLDRGFNVTVSDPLAIENTRAVFGSKITYAADLKSSVQNAECVIVTLPGAEYSPNPLDLPKNKKSTVIDCWGTLNKQHFMEVANYFCVGQGPRHH